MNVDGSRAAAELEAALAAYQAEWIKIENERGDYIRGSERHRRAVEAALAAARRVES